MSYKELYFRENIGSTYDKAIGNKFEVFIQRFDFALLKETIKKYFIGRKIDYMDFAAGTGRISHSLLEDVSQHDQFQSIDLVDSSEYMLKQAKENLEPVRGDIPVSYVTCDILSNPTCDGRLSNDSYDMITAFRLFTNLEPELRSEILTALRRYVKDDGIVVINNHLNALSALGIVSRILQITGLRVAKRDRLQYPKKKSVIDAVSMSAMKHLIRESGFRIEECYSFGLFPGHKGYMAFSPNLLFKVESLLMHVPILRLFAKEQIFVLRKNEDT